MGRTFRGTLRRTLRALALGALFVFVGCGGGAPCPVGFVNQTHHSVEQLWVIWSDAQASVAQQVDLNALQRSLYNVPPDIRPGNARAFSVMPRQLRVAPHQDVGASVLLAATGVVRSDPTGLIACPHPCNVRYSVAYSWYKPAEVRYAASWESDATNFHAILEYEFENQIMYQLGYDMKWR